MTQIRGLASGTSDLSLAPSRQPCVVRSLDSAHQQGSEDGSRVTSRVGLIDRRGDGRARPKRATATARPQSLGRAGRARPEPAPSPRRDRWRARPEPAAGPGRSDCRWRGYRAEAGTAGTGAGIGRGNRTSGGAARNQPRFQPAVPVAGAVAAPRRHRVGGARRIGGGRGAGLAVRGRNQRRYRQRWCARSGGARPESASATGTAGRCQVRGPHRRR